MTLRRTLLPALLLLALAVPAGASVLPSTGSRVGPASAIGLVMDAEAQQVTCEGSELNGNGQLTGPAATSVAHLTGTPAPIDLDVMLVLDLEEAVDVARLDDGTVAGRAAYDAAGDELFAEVTALLAPGRRSYPSLGITLNFVDWALLAPIDANGTPRVRTTDSQTIIDLSKAVFGGQRPEGADIVYTVSDLDLTAIGTNAVAGQADCIGGVANPDTAFAVGEIRSDLIPAAGLPIGPITFYKNFFAKIAAHEIGHLMGAHHHYQECGTPGPAQSAVAERENGPCSLMTNAVDFQTLPFSNLNGIVVRGHAEEFVADEG